MKKKVLGVFVVAVIAAVTGWNYNRSMNEAAISDLALANLEALASNEGSSDCERLCTRSGYMCIINFTDGTSISCPGRWK